MFGPRLVAVAAAVAVSSAAVGSSASIAAPPGGGAKRRQAVEEKRFWAHGVSDQRRRELLRLYAQSAMKDRYPEQAYREVAREVFRMDVWKEGVLWKQERLVRPWLDHASVAHARAMFGADVTIDPDVPAPSDGLAELAFLPMALGRQLHAAGVTIRLTDQTLDHVSGEKEEAGDRKTAVGVYDPGDRSLIFRPGNPTTLLHELGHAMGDILQIDYSDEMIAWHRKLFDRLHSPQSSIPSYFQQDGPGGWFATVETFAQTFANVLMRPADAIRWYGPDYVQWLREVSGIYDASLLEPASLRDLGSAQPGR